MSLKAIRNKIKKGNKLNKKDLICLINNHFYDKNGEIIGYFYYDFEEV